MRDSLDPDINEFNNFGFDINIAKFVNYHAKTQDLSTQLRNSIRNSTTKSFFNRDKSNGQLSDRSSWCRPAYDNEKCLTEGNQALTSRKNFSMTCIDKSLTTIPCEIMQKQCILTVLDVSRNHFEHFPLEILMILPLRILRIDYNRIKHIPNEIIRLRELEALSVSHNLLQKLPTHLGKLPNFRDLNVESNLIENFPKDMAFLKNLKTLNLLENKLSVFPCSFQELTNLEEFHFEWFKYAKPSLDACQRGELIGNNLEKLRGKLSELYQKGQEEMTFEDFIRLFSTQKVIFQSSNEHGQSILHQACLNEDMSVVRYILREYPQLLESVDEEGLTPLCASLLKDKTKSALYLLKNGANVLTGRNSHGTPIHIAAKRLNYSAFKEIVRLGANPNKIDSKGNTALHYAVTLMAEGPSKAIHIIQHLLDQGADPNAKSKENMAPIHLVAKRKDYKAMNWILSYNFEVQEIHGGGELFNINKRGGGYKWTPLHLAAYYNDPNIVMALGEAEAEIFKRSGNGYTPKMIMKQNSVTYKLLDKYEKEWIKKNVLFRRDTKQESLTTSNLKNLNEIKEIKNASKNKFSETSFRLSNTINTVERSIKTKLEFCLPKGLVFQNSNIDNSFEISPESETDLRSSIDEVDTLKDYCSEFSEHVRVETDACATDLLYYGRNTVPYQANRCSVYTTLRDKGNQNNYQMLDLDIEAMSAKLKTQSILSLQECTEEANSSKEALLSDNISTSDKMKTLFGLKSLYLEIENYLSRRHIRPWHKETFPFYIHQEYIKRSRGGISLKPTDSTISEMKMYYDIVPLCLLTVFSKLEASTYESQLLKITIINILGDMKYFPMVDFLQTLIKNPVESFLVVKEGHKVYSYLQFLLHGTVTEAKENQIEIKPSRERRSIFGLKG